MNRAYSFITERHNTEITLSRERLLQAKDLIKRKRYDEARQLLKTIDHPTATLWLNKLDSMGVQPTRPRKRGIAIAAISLILVVIVAGFLVASLDAQRRHAELALELMNATLIKETANSDGTSTSIAISVAIAHERATSYVMTETRLAQIRASLTAIRNETETHEAQITATRYAEAIQTATRQIELTATEAASQTAIAEARLTQAHNFLATTIPLTMTLHPNQVYYTRVMAAARYCPQINCEVASYIPPGVELTIAAVVPGDAVDGNAGWGITIYTEREMYVNSSWLMRTRPTSTPRR